MTGRTSQNVPLHLNEVDSLKVKSGDMVKVHVTEGTLTHLMGDLLEVTKPSTHEFGKEYLLKTPVHTKGQSVVNHAP